MNTKIPRRDFIKTVPVAAFALSPCRRRKGFGRALPPDAAAAKLVIEPFNYEGVKLLPGRFQRQHQAARDYWLNFSEDNILHGYRAAAGMPAPGHTLGGWCGGNSDTVFGQWLSGMSRMARATGDTALRDKAVRLFTEWSKTVGPNGGARMGLYGFEKLVCGLVDLQMYADCKEAGAVLEKAVDAFGPAHQNIPATTENPSGGNPHEWHTPCQENYYRAYQLTGNPMFKTLGAGWLFPQYWNKFADTSNPAEAFGYHAYSHVNTFCSAAMAYAVTERCALPEHHQERLRLVAKHAMLFHRRLRPLGNHQPQSKGGLGQVLEVRSDTFETACGSWAAFKLSRYLMQFTGDAHYGDWAERILYNGIGAALPVTAEGKTFYYSDYRTGGGMKVYYWDAFPCCAGTYIQAVADYSNLIYYKDATSLYVNLFMPSEVVWKRPDGEVRLRQETNYPEAETTRLTLTLEKSASFPLKFRVPAWTRDVTVKVNGADLKVEAKPGTWASIDRAWNSGDSVELRIPMPVRMLPVDKQHPERVALVHGPVALVMDGGWQEINFTLPKTDAELADQLVADRTGGFQVKSPKGGFNHSRFVPFYTMNEAKLYYMYFDKQSLPVVMW